MLVPVKFAARVFYRLNSSSCDNRGVLFFAHSKPNYPDRNPNVTTQRIATLLILSAPSLVRCP
jgi:hypothetical protein